MIEKDSSNNGEDINILGYLTIEAIDLINAPIAEGTNSEVLNLYIGHFEETPVMNGNIALCAHNRGYEHNYFANLKKVEKNNLIKYETKNKIFNYKVTSISKIKDTDISILENTSDSRITLVTCVENQPQYRYCVVGQEDR